MDTWKSLILPCRPLGFLLCYISAGGYDLLGRTKDQIRSVHQVNDARAACEALKLDALVLVGGMYLPSLIVHTRIKGHFVGL